MTRQHALIFDLDGTLIDSLDDITSALNASLAQIGKSPVLRADVRSWIGDGLSALCHRALGAKASPNELEKVVSGMSETYTRQSVVQTALYPKILKMLELLWSTHHKMAVLSNKPHALALHILEQLELSRFFAQSRGYITEEDKKPSPKVAVEIARLMDIDPSKIFIVGDSSIDIQTARRAGMKVIAVTWGYGDKKWLAEAAPDHLIDDPEEILSILKNFENRDGNS